MDISIIIPVYNAGRLINRCLDSVFNQLGNQEIEVILVDDGSTDNSVEIIRNRPEQTRIRLFQQENSGPAKARNKGIMEARGKYLAFLDADDYWLPEFLHATHSFLENNPTCIAVSVAQRHITTSGVHELPINWMNLAPQGGIVLDDFYSFWAKYNHVCTGSILIRGDIAKKTRGQRTDLRICEDLEYWAFLATYGKLGYLPKLLFVSDGSKVTNKIGWVKKHLPRWNAACAVKEWEKRISTRLSDLESNQGYTTARGRIARNLAYSILLSKRFRMAKEEIRCYGYSYPDDKMSKLLIIAVKNPIYWFIVTRSLIFREYSRM